MIKDKKLEEIVRSLDEVLQPLYLEIEAGIAEDIHVAIAEEILKHHILISEKGDALKELYEDGYLDGFEKGKGVVMGTTDCIPISEVEGIKEKYYRGKEITENGQRFLVVEGKKLPFGWPYPTTKEEYILKELNKTNKEDKT